MKLTRRHTLAILALSLACALLVSPASAYAADIIVPARDAGATPNTKSASVAYSDDFSYGTTTRFTFNVPGADGGYRYRVVNFLYMGPNGYDSVIDTSLLSQYGFTTNNWFEEKFYLAGKYSLEFAVFFPSGDSTYAYENFRIEFEVPESTTMKSADTILNGVATQCISECASNGKTEKYDFALWLNDWLVDYASYDDTYKYIGIEGLIGRHIGTCEAYHLTYSTLLQKVGIQTRRVQSWGSDRHVWTGVLLDDGWYHVDTTWDEGAPPALSGIDGRHIYFALPNSIIKLIHKDWNGNYAADYPNEYPFDAENFNENCFIKSGEIENFTKDYIDDICSRIADGSTSFALRVKQDYWTEAHKNVFFNLTAYALSQIDYSQYGHNVIVKAGYLDDYLNFTVERKQGQGNGTDDPPGNDDSGGGNPDPGDGGGSPDTGDDGKEPGAKPDPGIEDPPAPEVRRIPMYRMYNRNTGEHFYTASSFERSSLVKAGWRFERIGWYAPESGDPVYRLYNKNVGDHHYTLSSYERNALIKAGWRDEGIGWYSDPNKTVKLYREYNKNQFAWNHNYTTSKFEHDHLVRIGWKDEGTAWYGI